MRVRSSDGGIGGFWAEPCPCGTSEGRVAKWYSAAIDIQDRKRTEQLQIDLSHTNRVSTMGELVASISHELAQPLTVTTANAKASLR
jgi:C4-dicarboxylate-specific signal transduction histidine kinase